MRLLGSLAAVSQFGSQNIAFIAQVSEFQQALVQGFDKNSRTRPGVLPETRHTEDNVVRLRVVTGAVAIGYHWAVATEHFDSGGDLDK